MFDKGYSLSDVAAVTRGSEDGFFGGNGAWWILLFFMFAGWGGGYGYNRGGTENVRDAVAYGFDINNLENGVRGLEHGLADGFYDMNTTLLTGFGNVATGNMANTNAIMGRLADMSADAAARLSVSLREVCVRLTIISLHKLMLQILISLMLLEILLKAIMLEYVPFLIS